MRTTHLSMLTGMIALAVVFQASTAVAQDDATYVDRHVIQGNFESGAGNTFLAGNNNGRRVGAGGAGGNQRVNNPVIQWALPTLTNAEVVSAIFSVDLEDPAATSGATFDVVATLMNYDDAGDFSGADFNDDPSGLGNGSLIGVFAGANVTDGGTLTFDFGGDALTLLQSFYSGVNPTQTDAFIRLSASIPHDFTTMGNDRYNLLTSDGGSNGDIVSSLSITTVAVPEPSSLVLLGLTSVGFWVRRRRS